MKNITFSETTNLTVLTGAGISAESGLKTFRDSNGLWENHNVEEVATPQGFQKNPALVWKFYKQRYFQLAEVKPNPAHFSLVHLEHFCGKKFHLITQNVDGLHAVAGNSNIYEMHGTLSECFCSKCKVKFRMEKIDLSAEIPTCPHCNSALRPNIVWFGEMPYFMDDIFSILQKTDIFLVIGTSGTVYPAAQFLPIAKQYGAFTIGINFEPPLNQRYFNEFHLGKAGILLPELIKKWLP